MSATPGGLIIAAPASGSGKTVFTLGLLRHLALSGVPVASAKAGPDYIDPAFHAAATGRTCFNLDAWAMRQGSLAAAAAILSRDAEMVVCEGVMGLFDGAANQQGSTADLSQTTGWPVILVVDARAQGASAAALVKGFAGFRPGLEIAGVVFNRTGSGGHVRILNDACSRHVPEVPVLGFLPRHEDLNLPERHLGLVQAGEHPGLEDFLDKAAGLVSKAVNVKAIMKMAKPWTGSGTGSGVGGGGLLLPPLGSRIAVASDEAFRFSYPLVIEGWRGDGAEIIPFSPLAGDGPDKNADAVYLPGGYPELHAGKLAAAGGFLKGLREAAARDAAIFGECGGYMVLGEGITDAGGQQHAMAGLLGLETSFERRQLHLGYRRATLQTASPLGKAGSRFRGHEFHYATLAKEGPGERLFQCTDAEGMDLGPAGLVNGSVSGSFIHLIDGEDDA